MRKLWIALAASMCCAQPALSAEDGKLVFERGPFGSHEKAAKAIAEAIGRQEPLKAARAAIARKDFYLIGLSYHGSPEVEYVSCSLRPIWLTKKRPFGVRYMIHIGHTGSSTEFENYTTLAKAYAALYNRTIVSSKKYPHYDICAMNLGTAVKVKGQLSSLAHTPEDRIPTEQKTLSQAVRFSDLSALDRHIASGVDLNTEDIWRMTPLEWAVIRGHKVLVERLLEAGAAPQSADGCALDWATRLGRHGIAVKLLEKGADPDCLSSDGKKAGRPLYVAATNGDLTLLRLLLKNGADIDHVSGDRHSSGTALMAAAAIDEIRTVRFLLGRGASVDSVGKWDWHDATALTVAAEKGNIGIVDPLLKHGADIDWTDENGGNSALHGAAREDHIYLVQELIKRGADVNAGAAKRARSESPENSPLHEVMFGSSADIVIARLLLEAGADVNAVGMLKQTPLLSTTAYGIHGGDISFELVSLLIEHGADVRAKADDDNTVLINLADSFYGDDDVVDMAMLVLKKGAPVNAVNKFGRSALHESCYAPMAKLLLESGARTDILDKDGRTPLMTMVYYSCSEAALFLLRSGADPRLKGESDVSALELARKNELHDVVSAIEERLGEVH